MQQLSELFRFERTITFDCAPTSVYELWCDRGLWPAFTRPLCGSSGGNVLTMHRIPSEVVQWCTMEGAEIPMASEVWFHPSNDGRATQLQVIVSWGGGTVSDHLNENATLAAERAASLLSDAIERFQREMTAELQLLQHARQDAENVVPVDAPPYANREAQAEPAFFGWLKRDTKAGRRVLASR
jgi:hypothetical protein